MTWKFYPVMDLSGGLNLKQEPWLITDKECVVAENCDFWTKRGSVLGRKLTKKLNSAPLIGRIINFYRWIKSNGRSYLMVQTDAGDQRRIYYSTDNVTFYLLAVGCTPSKVNFVDYEDWLYFLDFNDTPLKWNGIDNPTQWGLSAPLTAPTITTTGVGLLTGTYTWKLIYLNAQGSRSPNSPESLPVTLDGGNATLELPVSDDPQVTKKAIYRLGGLLTDYYLVDTVDNSVTSYVDNIADQDAAINGLLDPYDRYPAPNAKYGCAYLNRIFTGNFPRFPHSFVWARARQPEEFYDYSLDVNGNTAADPVGKKGKQIMGIMEMAETLFFLKEEGIWALRGASETTFYLDNTYAIKGVGSAESICNAGTFIGYASVDGDGYYAFNGLTSRKITDKIDPIFSDRIDPSLIASIMAAYDLKNNRLCISYPWQALNDRVIVGDLSSGAIYEWLLSNTAIFYDDDLKSILIGTEDGYIYQLEAQYPDEVSYDFAWKSKAYDFQKPRIYKNFGAVRLTCNTHNQEIKVSLWADNQKINEVALKSGDDWIEFPSDGAIRGYNFQIAIEGTINIPITISPPLVFKYEETDIKTTNVMN